MPIFNNKKQMMKTKLSLMIAIVIMIIVAGCGEMSYKKTKTGLVYKVFPGSSKDSLAKVGNVVKFNFTRKLNDSLLGSTYGKMPGYAQLTNEQSMEYGPGEVFFLTKKGDSAITIEIVDTLLKKGMAAQLPPNAKKGDRITTFIKVLEIFKNDSLAMPDFNAELAKDKPRQEKEMKVAEEKAVKERIVMFKKEMDEMKKSGEVEKGIKSMEQFLAAKKITAQKTNEGTFVVVKEKGTGEPAIDGKFITVKYTGKIPETDSVFESSSYTFKMGTVSVIGGWDDGLKLFNLGGKGTLYVPGFFAYGRNPGPGGKPYQALIFDVEVTRISDTDAPLPPPAGVQNQEADKNPNN